MLSRSDYMDMFCGDVYRNYLLERIKWQKAFCEQEEANEIITDSKHHYKQFDFVTMQIIIISRNR